MHEQGHTSVNVFLKENSVFRRVNNEPRSWLLRMTVLEAVFLDHISEA